jgi:hypothetical protein
MTSKVILRTAIRAGFMLSILMTPYACDSYKPKLQNDKSHNLKYVQCDPDVPVPVTTTGVSTIDQVVFVCTGNDVEWFTDQDFKFTVVFDPASTPNDLFDPKKPPFMSQPDGSGTHRHTTGRLKVSNKAGKFKDYSYTIEATDITGKPVAASDPHVIPM